jgi:L-serine deaminase
MLALVTGAVAAAEVNVANMTLGRSPAGDTALMVLGIDTPLPHEALEKLRAAPGILDVRSVTA